LSLTSNCLFYVSSLCFSHGVFVLHKFPLPLMSECLFYICLIVSYVEVFIVLYIKNGLNKRNIKNLINAQKCFSQYNVVTERNAELNLVTISSNFLTCCDSFMSFLVVSGFAKTMLLINPRKKSNWDRSGERGGYATNPPHPIHLWENLSCKKRCSWWCIIMLKHSVLYGNWHSQ